MEDKSDKKMVIGILGGIGSGKSTVSTEFAKLGCGVIDADKIGHKLLEADSVKNEIISIFGEEILNKDEKIDRVKLGNLVFNNKEMLTKLNSVMHKKILEHIKEKIEFLKQLDDVKAIVLDAPLLVETGLDKCCDKLVFVQCDDKIRAERASKNRGIDKKQLKMRENFQISLDSKAELADNVLINNSGLSVLVEQVSKIFSQFGL